MYEKNAKKTGFMSIAINPIPINIFNSIIHTTIPKPVTTWCQNVKFVSFELTEK